MRTGRPLLRALLRPRAILALSLGVGLVAPGARAAAPLTETDRARLVKKDVQTHLVFEHYGLPESGSMGLIGLKYDQFITPQLFWGPAIYGAVAGERGGFGIAALGVGCRQKVASRIHVEARLLTGSGGGSGVKTGGGFLLHGLTGAQIELVRGLRVALHGGYLDFPTGTYRTPVASLSVVFTGQRVVLPY
jgi:hypothetical protein